MPSADGPKRSGRGCSCRWRGSSASKTRPSTADGDPCTDLLYTTNFAFLGLHEAAAATGDPALAAASDKLADFLVRCQARADQPAELDGVWFRGFDYRRWDYWGSNADLGWGVWSTETGWTQGWITSMLALRQLDTSFWELTKGSKIATRFDAIRHQMLPDEVLNARDPFEPMRHTGQGKQVEVAAAPADSYSAGGAAALVDGMVGDSDHTVAWLGFQGADMVATVDLGAAAPLRGVAVRCLQSRPLGIFLPAAVEIEASDDGTAYRPLVSMKPQATADVEQAIEMLRADVDTQARYIRVRARTIGTIPEAH